MKLLAFKYLRMLLALLFFVAISLTAGCDSNVPKRPTYGSATFTVDGETKTFYAIFSIFSQHATHLTAWEIEFIKYYPLTEYADYQVPWAGGLVINIPSDVSEGSSYDLEDYDRDHYVMYFDEDLWSSGQDNEFATYYGCRGGDNNFTLTITRWDGSGGIAEGTFKGILCRLPMYQVFKEYVVITDGRFEAQIE